MKFQYALLHLIFVINVVCAKRPTAPIPENNDSSNVGQLCREQFFNRQDRVACVKEHVCSPLYLARSAFLNFLGQGLVQGAWGPAAISAGRFQDIATHIATIYDRDPYHENFIAFLFPDVVFESVKDYVLRKGVQKTLEFLAKEFNPVAKVGDYVEFASFAFTEVKDAAVCGRKVDAIIGKVVPILRTLPRIVY